MPSAALNCALSVIFSIDGSPACVVSRAAPPVGRGGIWIVRVRDFGIELKDDDVRQRPQKIAAVFDHRASHQEWPW